MKSKIFKMISVRKNFFQIESKKKFKSIQKILNRVKSSRVESEKNFFRVESSQEKKFQVESSQKKFFCRVESRFNTSSRVKKFSTRLDVTKKFF